MAAVYWPFLRRLPGRLHRALATSATRRCARWPACPAGRWSTWWSTRSASRSPSTWPTASQGGPTAYVTAFAFFQLPYGIAAVSIITALVPRMAARHVDGDRDGFRAAVAGGLRTTCPADGARHRRPTWCSGRPLIEVLLEHGVVRGAERRAGGRRRWRCSRSGWCPFAAFLLFARAFYARQDSRTPALVNVVENAVTVALDFALFPGLGVRGLALAHSLGYVAGARLLGWLLARRIGGLELARTLREAAKALVGRGRRRAGHGRRRRGGRRAGGAGRRARAGCSWRRRRWPARAHSWSPGGCWRSRTWRCCAGCCRGRVERALARRRLPAAGAAGAGAAARRRSRSTSRGSRSPTWAAARCGWRWRRWSWAPAAAWPCPPTTAARRSRPRGWPASRSCFYRVDARLEVDADDLAAVAARADATYLISHFGFPLAGAARRSADDRGRRARAVLARPDRSSPGSPAPRRRSSARASRSACPTAGALLLGRSAGDAPGGRTRRPGDGPLDAGAGRRRGRRWRGPRGAAGGRGGSDLGQPAAPTPPPSGNADRDGDRRVGPGGGRHGGGGRPASRLTARARSADRRRCRARAPASQLRAAGRGPGRALLRALPRLPPGTAPLYLPVLAPDRPRALARLLEHGVRGLEIWPVPHPLLDRSALPPSWSGRAPSLLALPVHQQLRPTHVDAIASAASRALSH